MMTRAKFDPHKHCWLLWCQKCERWVLTVYTGERDHQLCARCIQMLERKAA